MFLHRVDIWTSVSIQGTFLLGGSLKDREVLDCTYDMNYSEGITNSRVWILEVLDTVSLQKCSKSEADLEPLLKSSSSTNLLGSSEALDNYNGLLGSRNILKL